MSRRWFRHQARQICVGWDRSLKSFFLTIAELCPHCQGTGEEPEADYFCARCAGEGIQQRSADSIAHSTMTLDQIAAELARQQVPFPDYLRTDLERDGQTDAGQVVRDYDLDPHRG